MATKDITDKQVVQACVDAHSKGSVFFSLGKLIVITGEPEKVCIRAMERAMKRGLIEYGVSLRTAWATNKGQRLLDE